MIIFSLKYIVITVSPGITKFRSYEFYIETHTLRLARHPNTNTLIRNLPNKIEHVLIKMQTKDDDDAEDPEEPDDIPVPSPSSFL
jgi:hypothetical protein